jgi:hypothetical protein
MPDCSEASKAAFRTTVAVQFNISDPDSIAIGCRFSPAVGTGQPILRRALTAAAALARRLVATLSYDVTGRNRVRNPGVAALERALEADWAAEAEAGAAAQSRRSAQASQQQQPSPPSPPPRFTSPDVLQLAVSLPAPIVFANATSRGCKAMEAAVPAADCLVRRALKEKLQGLTAIRSVDLQ